MSDERTPDLIEKVVEIRRSAKVTKGGRNFSFGAIVVVGNGHGYVGMGYGKAREVPMAVEKATKEARKSMVTVNLVGDTIPHEIIGKHGSCRVFMKPASRGTGVKAGGTLRAVLEVTGVRNVLTKCFGSTNKINVTRAALNGLASLASAEEVSERRNMNVEMKHPQLS